MLARLFQRPVREDRAMQVTAWGDWSSGGTMSHAGIRVDNTTALQLLTVYGCVALIADTIATLPVDTFRRTADGQVEIPTPRWIEQPNQSADRVEFFTQILTSLLLDGNAYVIRSSSQVDDGPLMLATLNPSDVEVRVDDRQITHWAYGKQIPSAILDHLKGVTVAGAAKGLSPVEAARQAVGLGLAAQEFGGRFFSQGQTMSGVIELPGELSPDAALELKQAWVRDHSGLGRAWEPGVLFGGAQWKPISVTPEQAQFLETRKFTAAEIAGQMFRVDPSLLGIGVDSTSLTYANLEQRGIHFVQFTLLPWIVRLERWLTAKLPEPQFVKFNVAGLERADLKTRYDAYAVGIGSKFLTPNEARALEDMRPIDGGDTVVERSEPAVPAVESDSIDDGRVARLEQQVADIACRRNLRIVRDAAGQLAGLEQV